MVSRSTHEDQQYWNVCRAKLLWARGTTKFLSDADQSRRWPLSKTMLIFCDMYASAWPDNDWRTRHATLYSIRRWTGSQCNWCGTGVKWSHRLVPVNHAATFWVDRWIGICASRVDYLAHIDLLVSLNCLEKFERLNGCGIVSFLWFINKGDSLDSG